VNDFANSVSPSHVIFQHGQPREAAGTIELGSEVRDS
jgi:hypothetical protein